MNKKKILIIEDEWNTIKGSFELANIFAFNNELIFENKIKSQDVDYNSFKTSYCAIFIDITLAKNSKWDGFNIIKKMFKVNTEKSRESFIHDFFFPLFYYIQKHSIFPVFQDIFTLLQNPTDHKK